MSWTSLPPELRGIILSHVAEDYLVLRQTFSFATAAPYATVSREWQDVFERITFRDLSLIVRNFDDDLASNDLANLSRFTSGVNTCRRRIIRNISVIVVLRRWPQRDCCNPETPHEIIWNNQFFTLSMESLLTILSFWNHDRHPHGLTLELNIKSASDLEHHFDDYQMHDDFPLKHWNWRHWNRDIDLAEGYRCCEVIRSRSNSRNFLRQGCRGLERYLGALLDFTDVCLPRVEVVTSLLQRHQFKRQLSPSALGKLINESLVQLSSLRLERWCRPNVEEEQAYVDDFRERFLPSMPERIDAFHYYAERPMCLNPSAKSSVRPLSIAWVLYYAGKRFKQVSVVEPYDWSTSLTEMRKIATAALSEPLVVMGWRMLENICFKSAYLMDHWPRPQVMDRANALLEMSASIAKEMPNLRSWEIYNTACPLFVRCCLFRYRVHPTSGATISLESWLPKGLDITGTAFSFTPEVKSAWDEVAIRHTGKVVTCLVKENEYEYDHEHNVADGIFEIDPVHPFSKYLAQVGDDKLLLRRFDR